MKKKKHEKILILYKDGTMLEVSEKKLEPNHMKKAKYFMIPIAKKPNTYWCTRPSKSWFAHRYVVDIEMDACMVDFEESIIENIGTIPSHYETKSLVEFGNFLCTLYRLNGYLNVVEEGLGDIAYSMQIFTPSYLHVQTLDKSGHIIRDIYSESLHAPDGYSDDAVEIIYRLEKQAEFLDDYLLGFDGAKDGLNCIPQLLEVDFNQMRWVERKKITKCKYNGYKLFRIDDFGAYFLGSDDIWNRCLVAPGLWTKVYGINTMDGSYMSKAIKSAIQQCDHVSTNAKIILSEACSNEEFDMFMLYYGISIADPYAYLKWIIFSEDIVSYMTLMAYMVESAQRESVDLENIKVLCFITRNDSDFISPDSLVCSQSEALLGKIRQYLLDQIYKEEDRHA